MWLFLVEGFYSVVCKDPRKPDDLTIRARVGGDLERLRDTHFPTLIGIQENGGTDYQYRGFIQRKDFAAGMATMIEKGIDYSNFKSAVAKLVGSERSHLYHDVWSVMFNADKKLRPRQVPLSGSVRPVKRK